MLARDLKKKDDFRSDIDKRFIQTPQRAKPASCQPRG